MHKQLFISISLLLVCEFALTQQNLRLSDASSAQVYWQAADTESAKIKTKKAQKVVDKNEETPVLCVKNRPKSADILCFNKNYDTIGKLNTKDKAYESRFWFGGQRAVLLAYRRNTTILVAPKCSLTLHFLNHKRHKRFS